MQASLNHSRGQQQQQVQNLITGNPQRQKPSLTRASRQDQQVQGAKVGHQPLQPLSSLVQNPLNQGGVSQQQPKRDDPQKQSRTRARNPQQQPRKGGPLVSLFQKSTQQNSQQVMGGHHQPSQSMTAQLTGGVGGPIKGNNLIQVHQPSQNQIAINRESNSSGLGKPRSYSKQMQPSSGLDLYDGQPSNNTLDVANMGRAKSNSINKTPEIKSHFRKNDHQTQHNSKMSGSNQASFLGQQANMMIRGRAEKNTSHTTVQQYTSHELPSVNMKQKNAIPGSSLQNVGRDVSDRGRRRLSNGAQQQQQQQPQQQQQHSQNAKVDGHEPRSQSQMMINKQNLQLNNPNGVGLVSGQQAKTRTGNQNRDRSEDFSVRQVQKYTQNAPVGRFTTESPLGGIAQAKFIPRKGAQTNTLPTQPQSLFQRNNLTDTNQKSADSPALPGGRASKLKQVLAGHSQASSRLDQHNQNQLDPLLSKDDHNKAATGNFRTLEQPANANSSAGRTGNAAQSTQGSQGQGTQGASSGEARPITRDRRSQKSRSLVTRPLPNITDGPNAAGKPASRERHESQPRPTSKQQESDEAKPTAAQAAASSNKKKSDPSSVHNVVTKFSFATKGGIAAHNPYKVNQDAYLTNPHMLNLRHCHFFSVCDGHGHNGQEVSGLLKHRLPFQIEKHLKEALVKHPMTTYPQSDLVTTSLTKAFEQSNNEVFNMVSDVRFSGSTCTSMITYGRKVYCANVGDSRTVCIRAAPNTESGCTVRAFSRDHKPDDPEESKVILANNGRIDSYRDQLGNQIGPMRVWLKTEDIPGLAMSRSFGDAMAARVGVNAIPEIKEFSLTPEDKIIVLASDGVWEFLENEDVAKIVYPFFLQKNAEGAAESLVRASFKRWKREESVIDDITCIIVFLDVK